MVTGALWPYDTADKYILSTWSDCSPCAEIFALKHCDGMSVIVAMVTTTPPPHGARLRPPKLDMVPILPLFAFHTCAWTLLTITNMTCAVHMVEVPQGHMESDLTQTPTEWIDADMSLLGCPPSQGSIPPSLATQLWCKTLTYHRVTLCPHLSTLCAKLNSVPRTSQ